MPKEGRKRCGIRYLCSQTQELQFREKSNPPMWPRLVSFSFICARTGCSLNRYCYATRLAKSSWAKTSRPPPFSLSLLFIISSVNDLTGELFRKTPFSCNSSFLKENSERKFFYLVIYFIIFLFHFYLQQMIEEQHDSWWAPDNDYTSLCIIYHKTKTRKVLWCSGRKDACRMYKKQEQKNK